MVGKYNNDDKNKDDKAKNIECFAGFFRKLRLANFCS